MSCKSFSVQVHFYAHFFQCLLIFSGFLEFDHRNRTLELTVDTEGGNVLEMSAPKRNLRTLSGGEKSYSTTALILALWESMQPPFRVLDEFDVFMDMVNRTVALGQIISYAKETRKFQCKFPHV